MLLADGDVKADQPSLVTGQKGAVLFTGAPEGQYEWRVKAGALERSGFATLEGLTETTVIIDLAE